jgi:branched-subunit amino acid ABC-type transport system permease component
MGGILMPVAAGGGGFLAIFEVQTIAGIVLGSIFALSALGIVLVYRVTGVLNFANGAMGMFSTFVAWKILNDWHPGVATKEQAFSNTNLILFAVGLALVFSIVLGLVLENGIFRWLRGRSALTKAVVTVGILLGLQALASLIFGSTQYHDAIRFFDPTRCPTSQPDCAVVKIPGFTVGTAAFPDLVIGKDQLLVIIVTLILAVGLGLFLHYARLGIAMRAVSDDPDAASLWGVPVNIVGSVSWMMGSLVAAIAGILLISVGVAFDTVSLTVLIVDALAAALIAGLVSIPLAVVGGFALGLLETYPRLWIQNSTGLPKFVAIVVILLVLLMRSERSLLRSKT